MSISFINEKTSFILTKGSGVKCLLFDDTTKVILSNLIPHSKFLDSDFFLFESIGSKRSKLDLINCVVVISPQSIKSLIEEVSDPCYFSYVVLFTNRINPLMLEMLARNDVYNVIDEVHEIYLDYYKQDDMLYTLEYQNDNDALDALYSFVLSLKSIPTIYNMNSTLADSLSNKLSTHNLNEGGELYIINRGYDLYTPLLYDWKYQGMISQFLDYSNQMISSKKYTLTDDFFYRNKFKDLSEVSEDIKTLINIIEAKKKIKKLNLEEIRDITTLSETIDKHMNIHKHILNEGMKILEISEMEYAILKKDKINELDSILQNKHIEPEIRAKLLIIYILKKENMNIKTKFPDLLQHVDDYFIKHKPIHNPYKYTFNKDIDPKIGYTPPIRRLIKHIIHKKIIDGTFDVLKERLNKNRFIILYFQGGITFGEYREIVESSIGQDRPIYVVSDRVVSYKDFIKWNN